MPSSLPFPSLRSLVLVYPLLICLLNYSSQNHACSLAELLTVPAPSLDYLVQSPLSFSDGMSDQGTVSFH